jgi:hypothetical protein
VVKSWLSSKNTSLTDFMPLFNCGFYYERYAVREANNPLASISLKKNRLRIVKSVYAAI